MAQEDTTTSADVARMIKELRGSILRIQVEILELKKMVSALTDMAKLLGW
jgi:hypothetical protein